jgi:hypothetical protein
MVETSEQPQEKVETPQGNDEVKEATEALEKKFERI